MDRRKRLGLTEAPPESLFLNWILIVDAASHWAYLNQLSLNVAHQPDGQRRATTAGYLEIACKLV